MQGLRSLLSIPWLAQFANSDLSSSEERIMVYSSTCFTFGRKVSRIDSRIELFVIVLAVGYKELKMSPFIVGAIDSETS